MITDAAEAVAADTISANWRVADGDRLLGPFSDAEMAAGVERGDFIRGMRVWREGLDGWDPLGLHFAAAGAGKSGRKTGWAAPLFRILASVLFLLSGAAVINLLYLNGLDRLSAAHAAPVWIAAGATLAVATLLASVLWWRWAGRRREPEARGILRIAAVMLCLTGGVLSAMELAQAPWVNEATTATAELRDYAFILEPGGETLTATGFIGPGFARALEARLAATSVTRLEITSPGGLIDEALRGARAIERRGLTVAARDECASACVIVLMGGKERLADYDMTIDFHATASILEAGPDAWISRMSRLEGERANRYMIARGVPAARLATTDRLGPERLYPVASVDLADEGMLTGLIDHDGRPINTATARLLLHARPAPVVVSSDE